MRDGNAWKHIENRRASGNEKENGRLTWLRIALRTLVARNPILLEFWLSSFSASFTLLLPPRSWFIIVRLRRLSALDSNAFIHDIRWCYTTCDVIANSESRLYWRTLFAGTRGFLSSFTHKRFFWMAWRGADHVGSMVWSLFPITCSHDDVFLVHEVIMCFGTIFGKSLICDSVSTPSRFWCEKLSRTKRDSKFKNSLQLNLLDIFIKIIWTLHSCRRDFLQNIFLIRDTLCALRLSILRHKCLIISLLDILNSKYCPHVQRSFSDGWTLDR